MMKAIALVVLGAACLNAATPYDRIYVFGDSYSDIGEGYLDGNGPTAVAYLAKRLGIEFLPSTDPKANGKSIDFAVSGGRTGSGAGSRAGGALLGVGMRNQVDDFAARVHAGSITFSADRTMFFLAGGLNDKPLPTETTVANLKEELRILHGLGARRFQIAILPVSIPGFSQVATRLNPALARIPAEMAAEFPDSHFYSSNWGRFFDDVMEHPASFGIRNTTDACAGRAIFNQDATPCASPDTYFYYHSGHPSTAVHRIVGDKLYEEALQLPH